MSTSTWHFGIIDVLMASWMAHRDLLRQAASLLNQQIWCWGRDVLRPEGNWLVEIGFERIEPPATHEDCSSVYILNLPRGKSVVLRGFGLFYGDPRHGGVFLPRYQFLPQYTTCDTLERPPWSKAELPEFDTPTESERARCISLAVDAIEWIRAYEANVVEVLGLEYRRSTLVKWDNGKRIVLPAEAMVPTWQALGHMIVDGLELGSGGGK